MGALHDGHLALIRAARRFKGPVVVSIFVNPLQFGEDEDFEDYPRTLEDDIEKLEAEGVDVVFAPDQEEVYPAGPRTVVQPGPLAGELEGQLRPRHFSGVLTVVAKLFALTGCRIAIFGEKDYQQLVLVRQMVEDLGLPVEIVTAPIIRERDGLARSSRNVYLSEDDREQATALSAALRAGSRQHTPEDILAAAGEVLEESEITPDYLELRSADLTKATTGESRLLVAAKVGQTRLLDNMAVMLDPEANQ